MKRVYEFKPGDVIGFSGRSLVSDTINIFTGGVPRWGVSHVGIIATAPRVASLPGYLLYESVESADRCIITGDVATGVQAHIIEERIGRYSGRVWAYPLSRSLYPHEGRRLQENLLRDINKGYDTEDVWKAGGLLFSILSGLITKQNLSKLFCSELVANMLTEIGVWTTTNAGRWSPNKLIRSLRAAGVVQRPIRLK